jgi:hypothetical protein
MSDSLDGNEFLVIGNVGRYWGRFKSDADFVTEIHLASRSSTYITALDFLKPTFFSSSRNQ